MTIRSSSVRNTAGRRVRLFVDLEVDIRQARMMTSCPMYLDNERDVVVVVWMLLGFTMRDTRTLDFAGVCEWRTDRNPVRCCEFRPHCALLVSLAVLILRH